MAGNGINEEIMKRRLMAKNITDISSHIDPENEIRPKNRNPNSFSKYLISTCDHEAFIDPRRSNLIREAPKQTFCYVEFPRIKIFTLLSTLYEFPCAVRTIKSAFILPGHPNRLYFELPEPSFISTLHPYLKKVDVQSSQLFMEFANAYLSHMLLNNFKVFARIMVKPYRNDPCQILDIDLLKKEAIIRVVPRLNVPELKLTIEKPKLFDPGQFLEKGILLDSTTKKILYSGKKKVLCCGFNGMWFTAGTLLTKINLECLAINKKVSEEEKELFSQQMVLSENIEDPPDDADWPSEKYSKVIKQIRDKTDTEIGRKNRVKKREDPREMTKITNEEKNFIKTSMELEKQEIMDMFIHPHKEPSKKIKNLPSNRAISSNQIYSCDPNSTVCQLQRFHDNEASKTLIEKAKMKIFHTPGSFVKLEDGGSGIVISANDKETKILLTNNNSVTVPALSPLEFKEESGKAKDRHGNRLFCGDVVSVVSGIYKKYQGGIIHILEYRLFGRFSKEGKKEILCWVNASDTEIQQ